MSYDLSQSKNIENIRKAIAQELAQLEPMGLNYLRETEPACQKKQTK